MKIGINLNELKPSIKMAMDIMDIYKAEFNKHDIKSVNITLINNIITVSVDENETDAETIRSCFGEALNNASKYIEETVPRPITSFSLTSTNRDIVEDSGLTTLTEE